MGPEPRAKADCERACSGAPAVPPEPGRSLARRVVRNVLGLLLLLLGIAGLVLPFLQGILMIVAGLALIDVPQKRRAHDWLLRWRWYRALARRHALVHERWVAWRETRRSGRKDISSSPPSR